MIRDKKSGSLIAETIQETLWYHQKVRSEAAIRNAKDLINGGYKKIIQQAKEDIIFNEAIIKLAKKKLRAEKAALSKH